MTEMKKALFIIQHQQFIKGHIKNHMEDNLDLENKSQESFSDIDDKNDLMTNWQNFIEGDSTLDLITGLNDIFHDSKDNQQLSKPV